MAKSVENDPHVRRIVAIINMDLKEFNGSYCNNKKAHIMARMAMYNINDTYLLIRQYNFRNILLGKLNEFIMRADTACFSDESKNLLHVVTGHLKKTLLTIRSDPAYVPDPTEVAVCSHLQI